MNEPTYDDSTCYDGGAVYAEDPQGRTIERDYDHATGRWKGEPRPTKKSGDYIEHATGLPLNREG